MVQWRNADAHTFRYYQLTGFILRYLHHYFKMVYSSGVTHTHRYRYYELTRCIITYYTIILKSCTISYFFIYIYTKSLFVAKILLGSGRRLSSNLYFYHGLGRTKADAMCENSAKNKIFGFSKNMVWSSGVTQTHTHFATTSLLFLSLVTYTIIS